jgi:hypothetical protein
MRRYGFAGGYRARCLLRGDGKTGDGARVGDEVFHATMMERALTRPVTLFRVISGLR